VVVALRALDLLTEEQPGRPRGDRHGVENLPSETSCTGSPRWARMKFTAPLSLFSPVAVSRSGRSCPRLVLAELFLQPQVASARGKVLLPERVSSSVVQMSAQLSSYSPL